MKELYIKNTLKGRGVFAGRKFKEGEIVEISPVIVYDSEEDIETTNQENISGELLMIKTIYQKEYPEAIRNIAFSWSFLIGQEKPFEDCIALLHGSLFNSANPANMKYSGDKEKMSIIFTAVKDIMEDEELTINYSGENGSHISDENFWFEGKGIKYID